MKDARNTEILSIRGLFISDMLKSREEHARHQIHDYSHVFRTRTCWELARLSAIAMAIEFAYAAETSFVSPILLQIGIDHHLMTMAWGLSPLIGFIISPFLGPLSDRCRLKWGRRRPLITLLSLGIVTGLTLVPWGNELGVLLEDMITRINISNTTYITHMENDVNLLTIPSASSSYSIVLTIVGMVLLDFDADICQTPARTYLLDMCLVEDQPRALVTFTLFAGVGGTIGYAIGAIDWKSTYISNLLGGNIPTVFALVTIIFLICYFVTITTFREIPLPLLESDYFLRPLTADVVEEELKKNNNAVYYIKEATTQLQLQIATNNNSGVEHSTSQIQVNDGSQNEYTRIVGIERYLMERDRKQGNKQVTVNQGSFIYYVKSIFIMPYSIRILSLTNLLCWMGHVTYSLYFTDFVGEAVFGGDPSAPSNSPSALLYEQGVRFGCWGLCIYALSCSCYSIFVNKLIHLKGIKFVYIAGILHYGVSMLILGLWPTKAGVLFFSISAGIFYGTLFTLPYILIANYHSKNCFGIQNTENIPLRESRGLGTDIAIISSMIFIAQFIVAMSIGPLVTVIDSTCAVLYASTFFTFLAAIAASFILYI